MLINPWPERVFLEGCLWYTMKILVYAGTSGGDVDADGMMIVLLGPCA